MQKHEELCSENEELRAKINERDQTLKDMANWTSQLTSELEEAKEIHKNQGPGFWKNDADVHQCPICEMEFTISRRKVGALLCQYYSMYVFSEGDRFSTSGLLGQILFCVFTC